MWLCGPAEEDQKGLRNKSGATRSRLYDLIAEDAGADAELRREINDGLRGAEKWNSANHDLFYGKDGDLTGSDKESQEVSMLALHLHLHLLQSALVHVNTLLLQDILSEEKWQKRLTDADRRTLSPLFWTHVNPTAGSTGPTSPSPPRRRPWCPPPPHRAPGGSRPIGGERCDRVGILKTRPPASPAGARIVDRGEAPGRGGAGQGGAGAA
ncbi:Tn3 family transposase [Streptomyces tubercidicus]